MSNAHDAEESPSAAAPGTSSETETETDTDRETNRHGDDADEDRQATARPGDGEAGADVDVDGDVDTDADSETWEASAAAAPEMETETETEAGARSMSVEDLCAASEIDPVMGGGSDESATETDGAEQVESGENGDVTEPAGESGGQAWCRETVDQATRRAVLQSDRHRCRMCGSYGPGGPGDGEATLEVHHLSRNPEYCELHEKQNLTTLCVHCHSWQHKRPGSDDAPVEIGAADRAVLRPYDYLILQVLDRWGPATVSEIADHLYPEHGTTAIRERLWTLMGLDNIVAGQDRQVIDQDAHTGEWCLVRPGEDPPIDRSARGYIPETKPTRRIRVEDELVRFLLANGWDRQVVADIMEIEYRTTWHKERRAQAYAIPLAAVTGGGRAARVGAVEIGEEAD